MLSYVPLHVCPRWLRGIRTEKIHKFSSVPPPFVREDSSFGLVDTHRQPGAKLGIQDDKINLILTRVNVQKGEREKKKKKLQDENGDLDTTDCLVCHRSRSKCIFFYTWLFCFLLSVLFPTWPLAEMFTQPNPTMKLRLVYCLPLITTHN